MKNRLTMKSVFLFLSLLIPALTSALTPQMPVAPFLAAKSYLLFDYTSNQILVNQNGNARMEPASLTKLMTAYLTFQALGNGTLPERQGAIA